MKQRIEKQKNVLKCPKMLRGKLQEEDMRFAQAMQLNEEEEEEEYDDEEEKEKVSIQNSRQLKQEESKEESKFLSKDYDELDDKHAHYNESLSSKKSHRHQQQLNKFQPIQEVYSDYSKDSIIRKKESELLKKQFVQDINGYQWKNELMFNIYDYQNKLDKEEQKNGRSVGVNSIDSIQED